MFLRLSVKSPGTASLLNLSILNSTRSQTRVVTLLERG
jgi:hypothetical protein